MDIHHLRTEIDGHHSYRIISIHNGQFVGTLEVYALQTDYPYLGGIYVHPGYRRRGITTAMITKALELVKQTEADAVGLVVKDDNEPAVKCYESIGFRRYAENSSKPGFGNYAFWYNR